MYNEALGDAILQVLNEAFPAKLDLQRLRNMLPHFSCADDPEWMTAVSVLWKAGLLEGKIYCRQGDGAVTRAAKMEITRVGRLRVRQLSRKIHPAPFEGPSDLDGLLQIYTRAHFNQDLKQIPDTASPLSLILVRVDQFQRVIETLGHRLANEILKGVAMQIKHICLGRAACYRYAEIDFAVILRNYTTNEAYAFAERIRESVSKAEYPPKIGRMTVSLGVVNLPDHATEAAALESLANQTLFQAAMSEGNVVCTPKHSGERHQGTPPTKQPAQQAETQRPLCGPSTQLG